jgi:hypothetical protein
MSTFFLHLYVGCRQTSREAHTGALGANAPKIRKYNICKLETTCLQSASKLRACVWTARTIKWHMTVTSITYNFLTNLWKSWSCWSRKNFFLWTHTILRRPNPNPKVINLNLWKLHLNILAMRMVTIYPPNLSRSYQCMKNTLITFDKYCKLRDLTYDPFEPKIPTNPIKHTDIGMGWFVKESLFKFHLDYHPPGPKDEWFSRMN